MNKLKYTTEPPTEEGWYFVSYVGNILGPSMVEIYLSASGLRIKDFLSHGDISYSSLVEGWTTPGTLWAGPFHAPDRVPFPEEVKSCKRV